MSPARVSDENVVSIGRAGVDDCAGILECLAGAFEPYRESYTVGAYLDTVLTSESVRGRLREMTVFVAKNGLGQIVGTIACGAMADGEGHLRGMAVVAEQHGSGVAQQLLETAEDELRRARCSVATLDTTAPLKRAIRFYEKHGYRATGSVRDFFGMPLYEYSKAL